MAVGSGIRATVGAGRSDSLDRFGPIKREPQILRRRLLEVLPAGAMSPARTHAGDQIIARDLDVIRPVMPQQAMLCPPSPVATKCIRFAGLGVRMLCLPIVDSYYVASNTHPRDGNVASDASRTTVVSSGVSGSMATDVSSAAAARRGRDTDW